MSSRREIFNAKLSERSANPTSVILTKQKYDQLITSVLSVKNNGKKISTDFLLLKKYDVLDVQGIRKLIVPMCDGNSGLRFYLHADEMFDELEKLHSKMWAWWTR